MDRASLQRDFAAFRGECEDLCVLRNEFEVLFGSGAEYNALLKDTAEAFFTDLHQWMTELFYLKIYRLTDTAAFGKRSNLTVKHLIVGLEELGLLTNDVRELAESLHCYREHTVSARNRRIAHLDHATVLEGETLGAHSREEYEQFFVDLQAFSNKVAPLVGDTPCDFIGISSPGLGDASDLIQFLRKAKRREGSIGPRQPD